MKPRYVVAKRVLSESAYIAIESVKARALRLSHSALLAVNVSGHFGF
jgi:hypothetical protein